VLLLMYTRAERSAKYSQSTTTPASWPFQFLDDCIALIPTPCAAHCRRAGLLVSHSRYPDVAYQATQRRQTVGSPASMTDLPPSASLQ